MKMPLFLILMVAMLFSLGGCNQPGMISVDAIDDSVQDVSERHDAYVNADASLSALEKKTYLRSTELLGRVLTEAKKPTARKTPDVSGYFRRSNVRLAGVRAARAAKTLPVRVYVPIR